MSMDLPGDRTTGNMSYACDTASVASARHRTVQQLAEWGLSGYSEAASILVTELAANAVRHAHSDFGLELSHGERVVHIVVSDKSAEPPVRQRSTPGSRSGFGLNIVNKLSSEWGWELEEHGKRVWADVGTIKQRRWRAGPDVRV